MDNLSQILKITNYAFKLYAIPNVLVTVFLLAISIFIFIKNKKSPVNISFLVLGLGAAIWIFATMVCFLSLDESVAFFWVNSHLWV